MLGVVRDGCSGWCLGMVDWDVVWDLGDAWVCSGWLLMDGVLGWLIGMLFGIWVTCVVLAERVESRPCAEPAPCPDSVA